MKYGISVLALLLLLTASSFSQLFAQTKTPQPDSELTQLLPSIVEVGVAWEKSYAEAQELNIVGVQGSGVIIKILERTLKTEARPAENKADKKLPVIVDKLKPKNQSEKTKKLPEIIGQDKKNQAPAPEPAKDKKEFLIYILTAARNVGGFNQEQLKSLNAVITVILPWKGFRLIKIGELAGIDRANNLALIRIILDPDDTALFKAIKIAAPKDNSRWSFLPKMTKLYFIGFSGNDEITYPIFSRGYSTGNLLDVSVMSIMGQIPIGFREVGAIETGVTSMIIGAAVLNENLELIGVATNQLKNLPALIAFTTDLSSIDKLLNQDLIQNLK